MFNKKIILLLVTFSSMFFFNGNADANSDPSINICNNCNSNLFWTENAKSKGVGLHEIYNLESGVVRTYSVYELEDPENPFMSILVASLVSNSTGALEALDEAMHLKYEIELHFIEANDSSTIFSLIDIEAVNGCGSPSNWSRIAPNWHLEEACNFHDLCFISGRSFESCNDEFEALMNAQVNELLMDEMMLGSPRKAILRHAILKTLAKSYTYAVNTNIAFQHFCSLDENTNSVECNEGQVSAIPAGSQFTGVGSTTTGTTSTGHTIIATCELWQAPDSNGGHYSFERNCTFDVFWSVQ